MTRKHALKVLEGFGLASLAVLLGRRFYVIQELLAALVLFSVGFAAVAFLGLALFLVDDLGQTLLLELRGGIRLWTTFAHRLSVFRNGGEGELSLVVDRSEPALDAVSVTESPRKTGS